MDCEPAIRSGTKTTPEKVQARPVEYHPKQLGEVCCAHPSPYKTASSKKENVVATIVDDNRLFSDPVHQTLRKASHSNKKGICPPLRPEVHTRCCHAQGAP